MKTIRYFFTLIFVFFLISVSTGQDKTKHALVIGIDGVLVDGLLAADTPVMDSLANAGAFSWHAFAGGVLGESSQQATSSGPGWSSILTGVWLDKHNVPNNDFSEPNYSEYPHFFQRIKEKKQEAYLSSIVNWAPINDKILRAADHKARGNDIEIAQLATQHLQNKNPDVLFLHFDEVDGAGHKNGYSAAIPSYTNAITRTDSLISLVLKAVRDRENYDNEDWLILITTDHGGFKKSHGSQKSQVRRIFIIASGKGVQTGEVTPGPGHVVIPPTVCNYLGIDVNPSWGWEGKPFGL
jgi:hypothetical protein